MLSWLRKHFAAAAGIIPDAVREFVYQQVYAVMAFLGTIVNHVAASWNYMWSFTKVLYTAFDVFGHAVYSYFARLVRVVLPGIIRWASGRIAQVEKWVSGWVTVILRDAEAAKNYLVKLIGEAVKWAVDNIWSPLWAELLTVKANLTKWGYTAWWYITHPGSLADLLLLYLVASLQRSIWNIARIMGEFLFKTVLSQLPRSLALIEQILADVL